MSAVHLEQHDEALKKTRSNGKGARQARARSTPWLQIGSDVEIARRVREDLIERFGHVAHAEGAFWQFISTHWESIPAHELRHAVYRYDGAPFGNKTVRLSKGRIDSVLYESATLCAEREFFERRPTGINCASGFIRFAKDGTAAIEPHHPDHRCRHTLPGHWQSAAGGEPPEGSLLFRLLGGVFHSDADAAEKIELLSEVCGAAALGFATSLVQPRAVILVGQTAEECARARYSISPADCSRRMQFVRCPPQRWSMSVILLVSLASC